jgi:3-carboxy-cis,cis-muconate cycloisomerase
MYAGGLAKMARDVALLMQAEVGEVLAAGGGSSTMPHKRNPSGCAVALAAAARVPGFASSFLSGQVQELERGLGGWQLEWSAVSDTVQATGATVAAVAATIEDLQVFPDRMRANLDATHGIVFAERALLLLRVKVGRDKAEAIVHDALARTRQSLTFPAALRANPEAVAALGAAAIDALSGPDVYVSAAETIRRELLSRS